MTEAVDDAPVTISLHTGLPELSDGDRRLLSRAARQALVVHLGADRSPDLQDEPWPAVLLEPRATFVTLREAASGTLRGCRGEIRPSRPLVESVREMAVASATGDPRFEPVRAAELDALTVDISVLGELHPIDAADVEVGRHGLMIVRGYRSGLLLPSVPVALGWDREAFLDGLCTKAGLPGSAWRQPDAELLAFETVSWGESTAGG